MKKIRSKILVPVLLLVTISLALVGGIASWLNYRSTFSTLNQTMSTTAVIAAERIAHQLKEYANIALETGSVARLANPATKLAEKQAIILQRTQTYGFTDGGILDLNGKDLFSGADCSAMEFFSAAKQDGFHVSEPLIWPATNQLTLALAAPLWEGGIPNTKVVGVVYFLTPSTFLNDIVTSIHISAGGAAYILDEEGTTIAHQDMQRVEQGENMFEVAKQNTGLAPLAAIHTQMVEQQSGFATYRYNGVEKFIAYAPISNTHGWSIAVNAPINDFMSETYFSIILVVILLVVFIALASAIAFRIASSISRPIIQIGAAAVQLAGGDLNIQLTHRARDELGSLADSMRQLCSTIVGIIRGTGQELEAMGQGDFTAAPQAPELYIGDFAALRQALDSIGENLRSTLQQINRAADEVTSGSEQVSSGAQALSQGATEQASSIQELSSAIVQISGQVNTTAQNAQQAMRQSDQASADVLHSNQRMESMMDAMRAISQKSDDIGKIVKTIEDIAFQTNILALNAAVEAARAGAAGKGFAVVADEVRSLAGKSAEAVKNTTALIGETVQAVEHGTGIAGDTAKSMLEVVESTRQISTLITQISTASKEQSCSLSQVTVGIDQISAVVQTNSATAEESAATSEELSGQAQLLKTLIGRFKLGRTHG